MGDYVGNGGTYNGTNDGPLTYRGRAVGTRSLTNGSSNILLVGEKYLVLNARTNSDCNDDQGWTDGWDNDTICFAHGKPGHDHAAPAERQGRDVRDPVGSSPHRQHPGRPL